MKQYWRSQSYSYKQKTRPDHGLLLVCKGGILFVSQNELLLAEPGDILFLPKGSRYEAHIPPTFGETEDYLVNFDADLPLPEDFPMLPMKVLHTENDNLNSLFRELVHWNHPILESEWREMGNFYFLIDNLLENLKQTSEEKQHIIRKAERLLVEHDELSVQEIADICGISVSGLRNQFVKFLGISPQQYRIHARIERSKFLLEATDLSLSDIAEQLGFYDVAYFCKLFKKYVGCSPRKYMTSKTIYC